MPDLQTVSRVGEPSIQDKVAFLSRPGAYPDGFAEVTVRETHMSWVFLAGARVYKLKKPVRFSYLDFSTLRRREAACRAELRLNRRLAGDAYEAVLPLTLGTAGLAIAGPGMPVDWLVVMRRLDDAGMLERIIEDGRLERQHVDRLAMRLAQFYRRAKRVSGAAGERLKRWRATLDDDRRFLLDPRLALPAGAVRSVDRALRGFLRRRGPGLAARRLIDGHGDLRPEHIWFGDVVRIIDCLEFNAALRAVDPLDEIAYLDLECLRLGAVWLGPRLRRRIAAGLPDRGGDELYLFYRCRRAALRARLAIAHVLEPDTRTPEKWPRLARAYLGLALADARRLEARLKRPGGR